MNTTNTTNTIKKPSGTKNRISPAAGIVPYVKDSSNIIHFLLGFENRQWSGFVGGYEEPDQNIINTSLREFNEETAGIFKNDLEYVRNKINNNSAILVTGNTKNRSVYLWFVQFPYEIMNNNLESLFLYNRSKMEFKEYKEKSIIKWFSIDTIVYNNILYKLRETIMNNYLRL